MNRDKAQRRFVFACLAPAVLLITIFIFYPTINRNEEFYDIDGG